jgi:hypothetical protein
MIKLKQAFNSLLFALKNNLLEYKIFNKLYHFLFITYLTPIQLLLKLILKMSKWIFVISFSTGVITYVNTYDFSILYNFFTFNMPEYHEILQNIYKLIVKIADRILNYYMDFLDKSTSLDRVTSSEEVLDVYKIPKLPVKESFDSLRASYLSPDITPVNPGYSKTEWCLFIVGGVLVIGGLTYLLSGYVLDYFKPEVSTPSSPTDSIGDTSYNNYFKSPQSSPKDVLGSVELKDLTPKASTSKLPGFTPTFRRNG